MKKIVSLPMAVLAMFVLLTAGCASVTGPYVGYVAGTEDDAKIVQRGGWSEEAVAQIAIVQNPNINGGRLSVEALKEIQMLSMSCQEQVGAQAAGSGQAVASGAAIGSVAGGLATGLGAEAAYRKTPGINNFSYFGTFGAVANAVTGGVNGYATGSYNLATGIGRCTEQFWQDSLKEDKKGVFRGTKIIPLPYGKRAGGSLPTKMSDDDRKKVIENSQQ